jgi:hypothetical protein
VEVEVEVEVKVEVAMGERAKDNLDKPARSIDTRIK